MEERIVTISSIDSDGNSGKAVIDATNEQVDFTNPGRAVDQISGQSKAIAAILRITAGNPPKDRIIAVLKGKL